MEEIIKTEKLLNKLEELRKAELYIYTNCESVLRVLESGKAIALINTITKMIKDGEFN